MVFTQFIIFPPRAFLLFRSKCLYSSLTISHVISKKRHFNLKIEDSLLELGTDSNFNSIIETEKYRHDIEPSLTTVFVKLDL